MKLISDPASIFSRIGAEATIVLHSGCAEPTELARQLTSQVTENQTVTLITFMPMGSSPYAKNITPNLKVQTFFPGKGLRTAVASGQAQLLRYPLSKIPVLFDNRELIADFLFLKASPPDERGAMTLGISVDYMKAVLKQKPIVVAEIDPRMPRTCGDTVLLPEQVDYLIGSLDAPQVVDSGVLTDVDRRIAENVASLVKSRAVLQAGIGALPDLVLGQLGHLHDLGVHSGIITNAMMPLLKSGVITNATKAKFRGKCVTTVAAGSQEFYDFLNENGAIEFHPCSLTHNREFLASIDDFFAINSVLEIDLAGRANAERIDGRIIAGPGGLPDFSYGAAHSKNGTSIIALRSTSPSGDRSNIRAELSPDAPVTVGADQIDYVVTEFGIARVKSTSAMDRARALVSVAHPDWRAELSRGA
jgi:4-hydroxybutyrate CoA-transferase